MDRLLLVVRGGGDLATGTVHRLWSAGFSVVVLEAERPAAIRRQVSLCEAVYEGEAVVEGMRGVLVQEPEDVFSILDRGEVPVVIDPRGVYRSTETGCGDRWDSGKEESGNPSGDGAPYYCSGSWILRGRRCGCGD